MNNPARCLDCGAPIPAGQPKSLCPRCALSGLLNSDAAKDEAVPAQKGVGRDFGDYELLEEIARGGMGVVYKARQKSLDRIVAVKLLLAGPHTSDDFIKRFRVEASAAAALQHPNIVAIHEVGVHESEHFLAMDYVDGPNLAKLVREQPLPPKRAAAYLKTIAEAIHYAHEKGILHRDLKPSNVLVDAHDQPRVTDFGLAKRVGTGSQPATDVSQLTLSGQVMGSPAYMPPEQASGRRGVMSRRSDVYSLGAMLYHLLTGRPPFGGGSVAETLQQVETQEPVSPRLLNPAMPRDLETICLKCLEKEPARRYPTAQELGEELDRFLNDESINARPVSRPERLWRWCRRKPAIAALIAALHIVGAAGLAGILWEWRQATHHATVADRERLRAEENSAQLQLERVDDFLAQNRAGVALTHLAQLLRRDPSNRVAATRLVSVLSRRSFALPIGVPMVHSNEVTWKEFSPDGRRIATASSDKTARIWDAETGRPLTPPMLHDGWAHKASFSPDGTRLVTVAGTHDVRAWDAASGQPLTAPLRHEGNLNLTWAQFTSDGRHIVTRVEMPAPRGTKKVMLFRDDREERQSVETNWLARVWDAQSGQIVSEVGSVANFNLSPDGRRIVSMGEGAAEVWDIFRRKRLAKLRHSGFVTWAQFSPDAERVATANRTTAVWIWHVADGKLATEIQARETVDHVAFSPDGRRLVTTSREHNIRVWDAVSGRLWLPPFSHGVRPTEANFSPDGAYIVAKGLNGTMCIWNATTGELVMEPVRTDRGRLLGADFRPDGKRLATSNGRTAQVWDLHPGSQLDQRLTHLDSVAHASFNPDGTLVSTGSQDDTARIWDARSGEPRTPWLSLSNWVRWTQIAPGGKQVAVVAGDEASIWDVQTARPVWSTPLTGGRNDRVRFNADGYRWAIVGNERSTRVWNVATTQPASPEFGKNPPIYSVRLSPDGRRLVTFYYDSGSFRLWDAVTGQLLAERVGRHARPITDVEFSPDGQRIVTASLDRSARLWDVKTTQAVAKPFWHDGVVVRACFSPDSRRVLTISKDRSARVWDALTGDPVSDLLRHDEPLIWGEFSPDGQWVLTVARDSVARVWDIRSGQLALEPWSHEGIVRYAEFSPDQRWIVTASDDGTARLWDIAPAAVPVPDWLPRLAEAVAGAQRDEKGNFKVPASLTQLKEQLTSAPATNEYLRWAQWFFADRETRTISAQSPVTVPQFVQRRLEEGREISLREVVRLQPTNAVALARLARRMLLKTLLPESSRSLEVDLMSRQAFQLAPTEEVVWLARLDILEALERPGDAIPIIETVLRRGPKTVEGWTTLGRWLQKTERFEEAERALTRSIGLAREQILSERQISRMLLGRKAVYEQLGRSAEAAADNLAARGIPSRSPDLPSTLIDLSAYYTSALDEDWTTSRNRPSTEYSFAGLPRGRQTLAGTDFDVRGLIQLSSLKVKNFPKQVSGIPLTNHCQRLHFLHSSIWTVKDGTEVGRYTIRYSDGQTVDVPLVYGQEIRDWHTKADKNLQLGRAVEAWAGNNGAFSHIRAFKFTWQNPRPGVALASLDFVSNQTDNAPFLFAITAE